jgi:Uma2 family endonuclease
LVAARRPDFHVYNELLVQYPDAKAARKIGQVVPDNMVVIHDGPFDVDGYYAIELQPAKPFWVLEYVSKSNKRKDYQDNMAKYEQILKVPYYLVFYPDTQDLSLFKYRKYKKQYSSVLPNEHERLAIPELEIEVALLDEWVRFWFRGRLLPLPADLQRALEAAELRANAAERRADSAEQQVARLKAEIESLRRRRNGA